MSLSFCKLCCSINVFKIDIETKNLEPWWGQMAEKSPFLCPFRARQLGNSLKWQVDLTIAVVEEVAYHKEWEVQGRSKIN